MAIESSEDLGAKVIGLSIFGIELDGTSYFLEGAIPVPIMEILGAAQGEMSLRKRIIESDRAAISEASIT